MKYIDVSSVIKFCKQFTKQVVCYTLLKADIRCVSKNVTLFTFTITLSDVGRFSSFWTWLWVSQFTTSQCLL